MAQVEVDKEEIRRHQLAFLAALKARTEPTLYWVEGVEISVNSDVFPSGTDTKLLASHIDVQEGYRTLDLTTGSGTISVIAGLRGASGIAVDINPGAVVNANDNFRKHNVPMIAMHSDLFQAVPKEQFDRIFANGPFWEGDIQDPLDHACYGARKFIEDLCTGVGAYLKPDGKLQIVMSALSDLDFFFETVKNNSLQVAFVDSRWSDDGKRPYNLYEITLPKSSEPQK